MPMATKKPDEISLLNTKLDVLIELAERAVPEKMPKINFKEVDTFIWHAESHWLQPVPKVNRVEMTLLKGIDTVRDILMGNTSRFAAGFSANNALLWGARGMGKSSLVKAAQATINGQSKNKTKPIKLVEIHREDIDSLPELLFLLRGIKHRFILFCDDLSFDQDDTSYKALKAALDGGVEGRPENVIFYATSNRRHLMPRDMIENERSTSISPSEAVEEKVSLSDRFGLWLGFHKCSQDEYLAMVQGYITYYKLGVTLEKIRGDALEWSTTRGSRSGRVAWQFVVDLAGKLGRKID